MTINLSGIELDYLKMLLDGSKESLDDICDKDRKVQVDFVTQQDVDTEYAIIDSLEGKFNEK